MEIKPEPEQSQPAAPEPSAIASEGQPLPLPDGSGESILGPAPGVPTLLGCQEEPVPKKIPSLLDIKLGHTPTFMQGSAVNVTVNRV